MADVTHDEERFLRAYPAAVSAGRWEEVARLLSGKCRALEKKAAAANKSNDALVAALDVCRAFFNDLKRDEADVDEFLEIIDAALALARGEG